MCLVRKIFTDTHVDNGICRIRNGGSARARTYIRYPEGWKDRLAVKAGGRSGGKPCAEVA